MRELVTKKIYYKKFNHRLAIKTKIKYGDVKSPTPEVIEWLLNRKFANDWRATTSSSYEGAYVWGRKPSKNLYTVFFSKPEVFDFLEGIIGRDYFDEYEKPLDASHTALMEKDKVITRTKLFYDKYRIAIRVSAKRKAGPFGSSSTTHIREMQDWCVDQFGDESANLDRYKTHIWTNGTFYFTDPKDAVLFKLVFGEEIKATERVVLVSELEATRQEEA